jgi:hypothetical protein
VRREERKVVEVELEVGVGWEMEENMEAEMKQRQWRCDKVQWFQ